MSEKKEKRELTVGRALFGFLGPIVLLVILIALGAEVTIAALAALFLMIVFCLYMGFAWDKLDAAMAEGVKQIATASRL